MDRRGFLQQSALLPLIAAPALGKAEAVPALLDKTALVLGPGVYEVPHTVVLQNATLVGAGRAQTVIKFTGALEIGLHAAAGDCVIENLTIAGNGLVNHGVMCGRDAGSAQTFMQNVVIKQCLTAGLTLRMSQVGLFQRVECTANYGAGALADIGPNVANQFRSCAFAANGHEGIVLKRAQTTLLDACVTQQNGKNGLLAYSAGPNAVRDLTISGGYFERNNQAQDPAHGQLRVEAAKWQIVDDVTIERCYFAFEASMHTLHLSSVRGRIVNGQHMNRGAVLATGYHPERFVSIESHVNEINQWHIADSESGHYSYDYRGV